MKKKTIIIVIAVVVLVATLVGVFILSKKSKSGSALPTPTPEVTKEVPLEDRPYISLTPRADGKELTLKISNIKDASTAEYELTYLASGLTRGVIGSISLNGETEISRDLLLGTCSRNVCKYDEGVSSGSLTLRLRGAGGNRKFISEFLLQTDGSSFNLAGGKFAAEGTFPKAYFVVMSTVGLPTSVTGKVIAGPYGVFSAGAKSVKSGKLSLSVEADSLTPKLFSLAGDKWQEVKNASIEAGKMSAPMSSFGIFVVANP